MFYSFCSNISAAAPVPPIKPPENSVIVSSVPLAVLQRPVARLQQQRLQAEASLGGGVGLVQPAGQVHHAEVRGRCVSQLLQDGPLQPQLPAVRLQQLPGRFL